MSALTWDPEVLARIAHLHLRARQLAAGFLHGSHASVRVAPNVEFADYKDYTPGDPLRDLDWKVLARSDKLVVRRHQAETELATIIVLDASGDMATGSHRGHRPPLDRGKWGAAATLAATLAWYLVRRGEPVGLAILGGSDDLPWRWLPPRSGEAHVAQVLATIAAARPSGRAGLAEGFADVGGRIPRRSLVMVVSDLMEEPDEWGPQVAALARRRTDVRVAHVYDPAEWNLDFSHAVRFYSPEGGRPMPVDPAGLRREFREEVDRYLREVRRWLAWRGALHVLMAADGPLERPLAALLAASRAG